jgi:hypothetical protein
VERGIGMTIDVNDASAKHNENTLKIAIDALVRTGMAHSKFLSDAALAAPLS